MTTLTPIVEPLDNAGRVVSVTGVDVKVAYSNIGAMDSALVKWGIYDMINGPAITPQNPAARFPVPSNHICDGYATVWFSVQDAIGNLSYSSVVQVPIATNGVHVLAAPDVTAVAPGNPGAGMQVKVVDNTAFNLTLAAGDTLTVSWDIYEAGGEQPLKHESEDYVLPNNINGSFTTPPLLPVPTGQQHVIVQYTLTRTQAGNQSTDGAYCPTSKQAFNSSRTDKTAQDLWPDHMPALPAPLFLNAPNDMLDLGTIPAGDVPIQIPATPLVANTNVVFHGRGADVGGAAVGAAAWTSDSVLVPATPYSGTPIPRSHVDAVPTGGSYTISYTVISSGQTAPEKTVTIRRSTPPPPGGQTGTLWGWGDPQWRTLG